MDPITLILSALVAGATAAAKETATEAVKDAYHGLKALIQSKFSGRPDAESVLSGYEKKPEVWKEPVKDALTETAADKDDTIIKAAQALLAKADPQGQAQGKYNVQFAGPVYGATIGDKNEVTNNFGDTPKQS
ncbi:MAG: hypothetical protein ABI475_03960 [Methylophilaceae bacterium]